jgi:soluble lytic murein transglycosylase-like protein
MTAAPILRSAALRKSLALTPVRRGPTTTSSFAATLARVSSNAPAVARPASTSDGVTSRAASAVDPLAAAAPPPGSIPFQAEITAAAKKYGLDPALLAGLVKKESNFNPSARSGAGAKGLTQLMDSTARGLGVTDAFDPAQSLDGGAKFLSGLLKQFHGDPSLALAAYNAGPGAVQKYGGIPPYQETQRYVPQVLGYAAQFRRIWASS